MPTSASIAIRTLAALPLLLLAGAGGCASAPRGEPTPAPDPVPAPTAGGARDDRWQVDLATLSNEIQARHPNAFANGSQAAFNQRVVETMALIPSSSDDQLVAAFQEVVVTLKDPNTTVRRSPHASGDQTAPYVLTEWDDRRAVVLVYRQCRNAEYESFCRTTERLFAAASKHGTPKIIVDLRSNNSGKPTVMSPLVKGFQSHSNLRGHVAVLIDGNTGPAATQNAWELKREIGAVLVGSPTGGWVNTWGDVRTFHLPNSGLEVTHPTRMTTVDGSGPGPLRPDVVVESSDPDAAMNAALAALP